MGIACEIGEHGAMRPGCESEELAQEEALHQFGSITPVRGYCTTSELV